MAGKKQLLNLSQKNFKRMKNVIYLGLLGLLFLQATCEKGTKSSIELLNTDWKLVSYAYKGKKVMATSMEGRTANIKFTEDDINGNTGCNNFFSSYIIKGNQIEVSNLGVTKMACRGKDIMYQEEAFATLLRGTMTYEIKDKELWLKKEDGWLRFSLPQTK